MKTRYGLRLILLSIGLALLLFWYVVGRDFSEPAATLEDGFATYYVAPQGACGAGIAPCYAAIQLAVDAVDRPGEVVKIAGGVYTDLVARAGVTQGVYLSKTLTLQGGYAPGNWAVPHPEQAPVVLDARGRGRGIYIQGPVTPTLSGIVVANGNAAGLGGYLEAWPDNTIADAGGGIYIHQSAAYLSHVRVISSVATYGGGIHTYESDVLLQHATITGNLASYGGGIHAVGKFLRVISSTLTYNRATDGGGLYAGVGQALLRANTISFNTATYGAGAYLAAKTSLVANTITLNTAQVCGGGLYVRYAEGAMEGNDFRFNFAARAGGGVYLSDSRITGRNNVLLANAAALDGGGMFLSFSPTSLTNTLIADNYALRSGSGLYVQASHLHMVHATLAHNTGGDGSGLYVSDFHDDDYLQGSFVVLTNTLIANHTLGITVTAGSRVMATGALWANTTNWAGPGVVDPGELPHVGDPAFVCASYRCAYPYRIGPTSAALDRGVPVALAADIEGDARPAASGYDIGVDEYQPGAAQPIPVFPRSLLAFYYPWYSVGSWDRPDMLDDPLLPYDSADPVDLARHLTWARAMGLDGFVVSWTGQTHTRVDGIWAALLDTLAHTDLQATIYFETANAAFSSPARVVAELEYVLEVYAQRPAFLQYAGRPVIFIYAVDAVQGGTGTPYQTWQAIIAQLHADGYFPFLIADSTNPAYLNLFDGLHTYFARSAPAVYRDVSLKAHQAGKLWAADIYPGYDDWLLSYPSHFDIPRHQGQTYSTTFATALQSNPDWLTLTSFNEWFENTHIEPSRIYGYDYLLQTAELAARFHRWRAYATLYVDATYQGPSDGSPRRPLRTLDEALFSAADGATVYLAGGDYTLPLTLTRSITLSGGYGPGWARDPLRWPTRLHASGSGPVVRVAPDPYLATAPAVTLEALTVAGNAVSETAPLGSGVYVSAAALTLRRVVVTDNRATHHGGGVFAGSGSRVRLEASQILGNRAALGGGVFADQGARLWLTNTIVANNTATHIGGGLYAHPKANVVIANSTVSSNTAPYGGGGIHAWLSAAAGLTVTNSIIWGNTARGLFCLGPCTVTYSDVAGGWPGDGNGVVDPQFYAPGDYHLRATSPLVDAGSLTAAFPPDDVDGDARPMGGRVDIGADEVGPLARSQLSVSQAFAAPGETLLYTLTLINNGAHSLHFWVTDTLPTLTQYVSGSLAVSYGSVLLPPLNATLLLPAQIAWWGVIDPGRSAELHFAARVLPDAPGMCGDLRNVAVIRSHTGSVFERQAVTVLGGSTPVTLAIEDAPGGSAAVGMRYLLPHQPLRLYAAAYNICQAYLGPVAAQWSASGALPPLQATGPAFTFTADRGGLSGAIVIRDTAGHRAQTGLISVDYPLPVAVLTPTALFKSLAWGQEGTLPLTLATATYAPLSVDFSSVVAKPFEVRYIWNDPAFIRRQSTPSSWSYYLAPEQQLGNFAGAAALQVTEVEVRVPAVNVSGWINWDVDVLLSSNDIPLPEGQWVETTTDPGSYARTTPAHFAVTLGARQDITSYAYSALYNFESQTATVFPYYTGHVRAASAPMADPGTLHAQLFVWTGDSRTWQQFAGMELTVRGVVTYAATPADWLTVTPPWSSLDPGFAEVFQARFVAGTRPSGRYTSTLFLRYNNSELSPAALPVVMEVRPVVLCLPLVMRVNSAP